MGSGRFTIVHNDDLDIPGEWSVIDPKIRGCPARIMCWCHDASYARRICDSLNLTGRPGDRERDELRARKADEATLRDRARQDAGGGDWGPSDMQNMAKISPNLNISGPDRREG